MRNPFKRKQKFDNDYDEESVDEYSENEASESDNQSYNSSEADEDDSVAEDSQSYQDEKSERSNNHRRETKDDNSKIVHDLAVVARSSRDVNLIDQTSTPSSRNSASLRSQISRNSKPSPGSTKSGSRRNEVDTKYSSKSRSRSRKEEKIVPEVEEDEEDDAEEEEVSRASSDCVDEDECEETEDEESIYSEYSDGIATTKRRKFFRKPKLGLLRRRMSKLSRHEEENEFDVDDVEEQSYASEADQDEQVESDEDETVYSQSVTKVAEKDDNDPMSVDDDATADGTRTTVSVESNSLVTRSRNSRTNGYDGSSIAESRERSDPAMDEVESCVDDNAGDDYSEYTSQYSVESQEYQKQKKGFFHKLLRIGKKKPAYSDECSLDDIDEEELCSEGSVSVCDDDDDDESVPVERKSKTSASKSKRNIKSSSDNSVSVASTREGRVSVATYSDKSDALEQDSVVSSPPVKFVRSSTSHSVKSETRSVTIQMTSTSSEKGNGPDPDVDIVDEEIELELMSNENVAAIARNPGDMKYSKFTLEIPVSDQGSLNVDTSSAISSLRGINDNSTVQDSILADSKPRSCNTRATTKRKEDISYFIATKETPKRVLGNNTFVLNSPSSCVPDVEGNAAVESFGRKLENMGYNLECDSFLSRQSLRVSNKTDRYLADPITMSRSSDSSVAHLLTRASKQERLNVGWSVEDMKTNSTNAVQQRARIDDGFEEAPFVEEDPMPDTDQGTNDVYTVVIQNDEDDDACTYEMSYNFVHNREAKALDGIKEDEYDDDDHDDDDEQYEQQMDRYSMPKKNKLQSHEVNDVVLNTAAKPHRNDSSIRPYVSSGSYYNNNLAERVPKATDDRGHIQARSISSDSSYDTRDNIHHNKSYGAQSTLQETRISDNSILDTTYPFVDNQYSSVNKTRDTGTLNQEAKVVQQQNERKINSSKPPANRDKEFVKRSFSNVPRDVVAGEKSKWLEGDADEVIDGISLLEHQMQSKKRSAHARDEQLKAVAGDLPVTKDSINDDPTANSIDKETSASGQSQSRTKVTYSSSSANMGPMPKESESTRSEQKKLLRNMRNDIAGHKAKHSGKVQRNMATKQNGSEMNTNLIEQRDISKSDLSPVQSSDHDSASREAQEQDDKDMKNGQSREKPSGEKGDALYQPASGARTTESKQRRSKELSSAKQLNKERNIGESTTSESGNSSYNSSEPSVQPHSDTRKSTREPKEYAVLLNDDVAGFEKAGFIEDDRVNKPVSNARDAEQVVYYNQEQGNVDEDNNDDDDDDDNNDSNNSKDDVIYTQTNTVVSPYPSQAGTSIYSRDRKASQDGSTCSPKESRKGAASRSSRSRSGDGRGRSYNRRPELNRKRPQLEKPKTSDNRRSVSKATPNDDVSVTVSHKSLRTGRRGASATAKANRPHISPVKKEEIESKKQELKKDIGDIITESAMGFMGMMESLFTGKTLETNIPDVVAPVSPKSPISRGVSPSSGFSDTVDVPNTVVTMPKPATCVIEGLDESSTIEGKKKTILEETSQGIQVSRPLSVLAPVDEEDEKDALSDSIKSVNDNNMDVHQVTQLQVPPPEHANTEKKKRGLFKRFKKEPPPQVLSLSPSDEGFDVYISPSNKEEEEKPQKRKFGLFGLKKQDKRKNGTKDHKAKAKTDLKQLDTVDVSGCVLNSKVRSNVDPAATNNLQQSLVVKESAKAVSKPTTPSSPRRSVSFKKTVANNDDDVREETEDYVREVDARNSPSKFNSLELREEAKPDISASAATSLIGIQSPMGSSLPSFADFFGGKMGSLRSSEGQEVALPLNTAAPSVVESATKRYESARTELASTFSDLVEAIFDPSPNPKAVSPATRTNLEERKSNAAKPQIVQPKAFKVLGVAPGKRLDMTRVDSLHAGGNDNGASEACDDSIAVASGPPPPKEARGKGGKDSKKSQRPKLVDKKSTTVETRTEPEKTVDDIIDETYNAEQREESYTYAIEYCDDNLTLVGPPPTPNVSVQLLNKELLDAEFEKRDAGKDESLQRTWKFPWKKLAGSNSKSNSKPTNVSKHFANNGLINKPSTPITVMAVRTPPASMNGPFSTMSSEPDSISHLTGPFSQSGKDLWSHGSKVEPLTPAETEDAWNEITKASGVVKSAINRMHSDEDDVPITHMRDDGIDKVVSNFSDESSVVNVEVEDALNTIRHHAQRLGVRESDLLLATVQSDESNASFNTGRSGRNFEFSEGGNENVSTENLLDVFMSYFQSPPPKRKTLNPLYQ